MLFEKALTVFAVVEVLGCDSCNIVRRERISVSSGDSFSTPHISVDPGQTHVSHKRGEKTPPFCGGAVQKLI